VSSIDDSKYPGCSAVYQTPGADPKQRWWHVLDNAFILPEYVAEVSLGQAAGEMLLVQLHQLGQSLIANDVVVKEFDRLKWWRAAKDAQNRRGEIGLLHTSQVTAD